MTTPSTKNRDLSHLPQDKPLVMLELLYMFGTGGFIFIALLVCYLTGIADIPFPMIGSIPICILMLSLPLRIFYPFSRWTVLAMDGHDLNNGYPEIK
jgi:hypothetical protein